MCLQGSVVIEPDMIQVINPLFILILVPVCESLLFPCMAKLRIPNGYVQNLLISIKKGIGGPVFPLWSHHIAKSPIFENNRLTIGEQKNAIQNFYNPIANRISRYVISLFLDFCWPVWFWCFPEIWFILITGRENFRTYSLLMKEKHDVSFSFPDISDY